jgi:ABC-type polysaccharide/polyol phosphate transport system ATPase subunit
MHALAFHEVSKRYQRPHLNRAQDDLWALRNVTFTAGSGEAIGVLGRNGSGKSTLLKLAAGVMRPSSGTVQAARPIAPMLELGAGFHPDLSGRDNVMLNGGLIGLDPQRLTPAVFDEIVAFAELEDHIDAPVKHYSSGMYARLGFAVAVHSPARVLLVDEVLSVGDALFRHKCLERMRALRDQGVTILLVSHDLWTVSTFCTRALVIDRGELFADAPPGDALRQYNELLRQGDEQRQDHRGWIFDPRLEDPESGKPLTLLSEETLRLTFGFDLTAAPGPCHFVARVMREDGVCCGLSVSASVERGRPGEASMELRGLRILPGRYFVHITIVDDKLPVALAELAGPAFAAADANGEVPLTTFYGGVIPLEAKWRVAGEP